MITAQGMSALSGLVNLVKLDLERCPKIHGGLVHLKGVLLFTLFFCNISTQCKMESFFAVHMPTCVFL